MDEVAIDFAKEINGISIQEGVEYVAYIYVEYKTEPFLILDTRKNTIFIRSHLQKEQKEQFIYKQQ